MFSQAAFHRVCNLRLFAIVVGFCALHAVSRVLSWVDAEPNKDWLWELARFGRQTLLTGLSLWLAVGVAEGLLAARTWARWQRLGIQMGAVLGGAVLGTLLRFLVSRAFMPDLNVKPGWVLSTLLLWAALGGLAYALLNGWREQRARIADVQQLEREAQALREREAQARLSALNAQIEPHFLFNTLANVKRLHETQPELGRHMLAALIAYLRAALPAMRSAESTLSAELDSMRHYLAILQLRMGDRLSFDVQAEPELLAQGLPPLLLPTLVENAIKHGLAPLPEGGRIEIEARALAGARWQLEVRDNGRGFGAAASSGTGVGLANIRARLLALFGDAATLELEAAQPRGVIARLRLPRSA